MQRAAPLVVAGGVGRSAMDAMPARAARRDRVPGFRRTKLPEKSRASVRTEQSRKNAAGRRRSCPEGAEEEVGCGLEALRRTLGRSAAGRPFFPLSGVARGAALCGWWAGRLDGCGSSSEWSAAECRRSPAPSFRETVDRSAPCFRSSGTRVVCLATKERRRRAAWKGGGRSAPVFGFLPLPRGLRGAAPWWRGGMAVS